MGYTTPFTSGIAQNTTQRVSALTGTNPFSTWKESTTPKTTASSPSEFLSWQNPMAKLPTQTNTTPETKSGSLSMGIAPISAPQSVSVPTNETKTGTTTPSFSVKSPATLSDKYDSPNYENIGGYDSGDKYGEYMDKYYGVKTDTSGPTYSGPSDALQGQSDANYQEYLSNIHMANNSPDRSDAYARFLETYKEAEGDQMAGMSELPTNEQGETAYDLQRQQVTAETEDERQRAEEQLKRQMAAQGLGDSGIALKAQERMNLGLAKTQAQRMGQIDQEELQAIERASEAAKERQWKSGERLGSQAFATQSKFMDQDFNERLADKKQSFEIWARQQGWTEDRIAREWQSIETEENRKHDEAKMWAQNAFVAEKEAQDRNLTAILDRERRAFDEWAAQSGYEEDAKERLWRDYQLDVINRHEINKIQETFKGEVNKWLAELPGQKELTTLEYNLKGGLLNTEALIDQRSESRKLKADAYYNAGINKQPIPENLQYTDPDAYYAYQQGASGREYTDFNRELSLKDWYAQSAIGAAATEYSQTGDEAGFLWQIREIMSSVYDGGDFNGMFPMLGGTGHKAMPGYGSADVTPNVPLKNEPLLRPTNKPLYEQSYIKPSSDTLNPLSPYKTSYTEDLTDPLRRYDWYKK